MVMLSSCKYHKGDLYTARDKSVDSLLYVIAAKGKGIEISEKAVQLKMQHAFKGDSFNLRYLTDSASMVDQKGVLLSHSFLPEIENDMLTKGYFGTFTSKQQVTCILVSFEDLEKLFVKAKNQH
jgi:hypothetical protein